MHEPITQFMQSDSYNDMTSWPAAGEFINLAAPQRRWIGKIAGPRAKMLKVTITILTTYENSRVRNTYLAMVKNPKKF